MIKTVLQVFRVQSAMSCNRFLFWLKKLPLIRRLFPDRLYAASTAKQRLMAVVEVLKLLYAFCGKFVYLFLFCAGPSILFFQLEEEGALTWAGMLHSLFFLSFFAGCFAASEILSPTLIKYTCVRQMGMSARACVAATAGRSQILTLVTFTPALIVVAVIFGQSWWQGVVLSLELAACRCLAERFHLWLFARRGKALGNWYVIGVIILALAAAYVPVFAGFPLEMDRFLFNGAVAVVLLLGGVWAAVSLIRYPRYREIIVKTCRPETVSFSAAKQSAAKAAFRDVEMKDSDLAADSAGEKLRRLKGYEYLNAVFFRRHRRLLNKPVKYVLLAVAAAAAVGTAACLIFPQMARPLVEELPAVLPVCVFLMYLICNTLGQRICKAMFYNCDISLLRFGWYRQRKVVLRNFTIRLLRVCAVNLLVALSLCALVVLLVIASGARLGPLELIPFLLCLLFLAVFFSVHPLFLYYVFQPYTTQLSVKNPFFVALNWVVYMVCYLCIQIRQPPAYFALIVLSATVAYCAVALVLVWKRAPKTFRVK